MTHEGTDQGRSAGSGRSRSAVPAVALVAAASLLLAAHFFRSFALPFVGLFVLLPLLLTVRRPWAVRVMQIALVFGSFEWVTTTVRILGERRVRGEPAGRMLLIMGGVTMFTLLAALVLETAGARRRFGLGAGRVSQTVAAGPASGVAAALTSSVDGPLPRDPSNGPVASPGAFVPDRGPSREDMLAVAAFSPVFDRPGFVAGAWRHPEPGPDGVTQMSYWEPDPAVQKWHESLYRHGLVVSDLDWRAADRRELMARVEADPSVLASADLDTVRNVLSTIVRADRFNEGYIGSMFVAGVAQAATSRLAALAAGG